MTDRLSEEGADLLFREARTHNGWVDKPVRDETLRELYELLKWGPTSANSCPMRICFVKTPEAKERLRPALAAGNVDKTMAAPVTAIIAFDLRFYEQMPKLFPKVPAYGEMFRNDPVAAQTTAFRNGSLQGAYFIIAARAVGLDCGPMSGFYNAKVDEEFFGAGNELDPNEQDFFATGSYRSNFLCNVGYGDPSKLYPRGPRLDFEEACRII